MSEGSAAETLLRLVAQIGRQPAFDDRRLLAQSPSVVFDLIERDSIHAKVSSLGMRKIPAADTRRRIHREVLGQRHARFGFRIKQIDCR